MKYEIDGDLKKTILEIDSVLHLVEVKGESVERIYVIRTMLKELFRNLNEIKEKEE